MTTEVCQSFALCNTPKNEVISKEELTSPLTTTQSLKQAKVSSGKGKAKNYLDPEPKGCRFLLIMEKIMFMGVHFQCYVFLLNIL